jgi:hypothetical protein
MSASHPIAGRRLITKRSVALHNIASYMSAYEIADDLIGKLEALIVRALANDLLNVGVDASRGMPRMTLRLRYRTWKLRALCWVLERLRGGWLARPKG